MDVSGQAPETGRRSIREVNIGASILACQSGMGRKPAHALVDSLELNEHRPGMVVVNRLVNAPDLCAKSGVTAPVKSPLLRLAAGLLLCSIGMCSANLWASDVAGSDDEAKLHIGIREVPAVMALPSNAKEEDPDARFNRACAALEKRLQFPTGLLQQHLQEFAKKLLQSADTPPLERVGALFTMGRYAEAEAAALSVARDSNGDVKSLELAGRCAAQLGDLDRALHHYRAAAEHVSEENDPMEWAGLERNIAIVLINTGKLGEAEALWRRILEIHLARLKPDHPDIMSARNVFANILVKEGKFSEAASQYREVVSALERVRGPQHPDTVRAQQNLERTLKAP